jgi:hypothetical protein
MKKLVKDQNGNLAELVSINGFVPEGWELVPENELEASELAIATRDKMSEIRGERNRMLSANDVAWLIASKQGQATTALEADAQILRDMPEDAEAAIHLLESAEAIKAYDAFVDLELSRSY